MAISRPMLWMSRRATLPWGRGRPVRQQGVLRGSACKASAAVPSFKEDHTWRADMWLTNTLMLPT